MKQIITIGDIHGRTSWKEIVAKYNMADVYKIVFVGDYVDSFDYTNDQIEDNLRDIINFKKEYLDKVVLLLGNHDLHYIIPNILPTAGYRGEAAHTLGQLFKENIDLFDMVYEYNDVVWSHAGITNTYYNYVLDFIENHRHKRFIDTENYATLFNSLLRINEFNHLWKISEASKGISPFPSLEWCRPKDIINDKLDVYLQVVGHTNYETIQFFIGDHLIIVDNLGYETEELVLKF